MSAAHLSDIANPMENGIWSVHGSAIAFDGQGVLFFGPSGVGKSSQSLALITLGATLVADDVVHILPGPTLRAPDGAIAAIEARGVGLLAAELLEEPVPFALAIDLAVAETERLPPSRRLDCGGSEVPLIRAKDHPNLAPVIVQYLRKGRRM